MANVVADIFRQAAQFNTADSCRKGSTVHLTDDLDVTVTGDIHGNRSALSRVIAYAAVDRRPDRRLILQEIIHGSPDPRSGHDRSVEMMLRAARLKIEQRDKVILLLSNHDLAQVTGNEITKAGRRVCQAFVEGVEYCFGTNTPDILEAIKEFCLSMPLAVRCSNGVLITHSLPSPQRMETAGVDILDRDYKQDDLRRGGAVYEWTWGRQQTDQQTDALAQQLGVELFLLGHHKVDNGYKIVTSRAVSIASDDDHGCVVRFNTAQSITVETIAACIKPIVALGKVP